MKKFFILLILSGMVCFFGCQHGEPEKPSDKVVLQLKWVHQAQFAGFYMAKELGFYAEERLDVTFLEGGPSIDQAESVRTGKADFAVLPAEKLLLDNSRQPTLSAVSVIYQRNPTMFVAKQGSDIIRPEDLEGMVIAVGDLDQGGFIEGIIQLHSLFKRLDLDIGSIITSPYDPQYESFLAGEADVTPAYLVGGVPKLRRKGVKLNMIWPGDYGIDFYSDTLASTTDYLNQNPEIAARFIRASLRGWRECIKNQEQAIELTMKYAQVKDRQVQKDMMHSQVALVNTGDTPIGWMNRGIWQQMYDELLGHGLIEVPIEDISSVFTMRFLNDTYDRSQQ